LKQIKTKTNDYFANDISIPLIGCRKKFLANIQNE